MHVFIKKVNDQAQLNLSSRDGYAVIGFIGIMGVVLGLMLGYISLSTRNKMVESQNTLTQNQLKSTNIANARLFNQYVKAGYFVANCKANNLTTSPKAPAHVKNKERAGGTYFETCDPRPLANAGGNAVYGTQGSLPTPPNCGSSILTRLRVTQANWSDRYVVVEAATAPRGPSPLTGQKNGHQLRARIDLPPPPVPTFGLLVNDLHCGMCHLQVNGDVASTSDVHQFHIWNGGIPWQAYVNGAWYAAKSWNPSGGAPSISVKVQEGVSQNYNGTKLPGRYSGSTFVPEYPKIDFDAVASYHSADTFNCIDRPMTTENGNTVLIGTQEKPIQMDGDRHIKGDLVITGWYKGVGSIYVDGNVYIPFDLRAMRSVFPFSQNKETAEAQAKESVKKKMHDGLAIATRRNIIIGEFDDSDRPGSSVWYHRLTPKDKNGDKLGIKDIYKWYKNGRSGYEELFGTAWNCKDNTPNGHRGSINIIEAYLYAENTIGGLARSNSFSINGGIIADNFHVVTAAKSCVNGIHPIHKQSMKWSYVNYDYRMKYGFPLLDRFAEYFH